MPRSHDDTSEMNDLIDAVKKHQKFSKLANYNLQCLVRKIRPPTSGWRNNLKAVLKHDGLSAVKAALSAHEGNPEILNVCSTFLSCVACDAKGAQLIFESNLLEKLVNNVCVDIEHEVPADQETAELEMSSISTCFELINNCVTQNPKAALKHGALNDLVKLMKILNKSNRSLAYDKVLHAIELLTRMKEGLEVIIQPENIAVFLDSLQNILRVEDGRASASDSALRLLERISRDESTKESIQGHESNIVALSNACKDNSSLGHITAQIITRTSGTNSVASQLAILVNSTLTEDLIASSGILSVLALDNAQATNI
eukprot:g2726.t1